MRGGEASAGGRAVAGLCWVALLLGLWLWGEAVSGGSGAGIRDTAVGDVTTGDVAAAGRPAVAPLPPVHAPLAAGGDGEPRRVEIESAGVAAGVVARGLDEHGAPAPPPYASADTVGWYGGSAEPGAPGVAILTGHLDTDAEPAVFRRLGEVRAGDRVRVERRDGAVAEFTVESVEVFTRERFDAGRVYGQREPGRAELRLITCGGRFDPRTRSYAANVVVSAYLTGTGRAVA